MQRPLLARPRGLTRGLYGLAVASGLAVTLIALATGYSALTSRGVARNLLDEFAAHRSLLLLNDRTFDQRTAVLALDNERAPERWRDVKRLERVTADIAELQDSGSFDGRIKARLAKVLAAAQSVAAEAAGGAPASGGLHRSSYLTISAALLNDIHKSLSERAGNLEAGVQMIGDGDRHLLLMMGAVLTLCFSVLVPLLLMYARGVVGRIKHVTHAMRQIADCDTAIDVPSTVDADEVGELARAVQVFKQNTIALLRNNSEIERLKGWFDMALDNMQRGLSIFDKDQRLVMSNACYREIYSLPERLVRTGTPFADILHHWKTANAGPGREPDASIDVDQVLENYRTSVAEGDQFVRVHVLDNNRVIVVTYRPLADGGWVDVHEDVTDRLENEEKIRRLARVDPLTGLANRRYLLDTLAAQLEVRGDGDEIAVVLLDLHGFKRINETMGHKAGDELLCSVARRLEQAVLPGQCLARMGGDGFAIVMPETSARKSAQQLTALQATLAAPFVIGSDSVEIIAGVGVAMGPGDGVTAAELMQRADIALACAKQSGRGGNVFFEAGLESAMRERQSLEADLKGALERGELELHYQPIVDIARRKVTSLEALLRWRHPVRGMVLPSAFIPLAEETGLIAQLGEWAIRRACLDALKWPMHVRVAVNLSAIQFEGSDLIRVTSSALQTSGLPASRLEFEVTESLLLSDESRTRQTLNQLKAMGLSIALDDFGTGYASLSYLRSFPFDKIKIDQTFVRGLPDQADCHAIVQSVVALAGMLAMRTVAEGVETEEQLQQATAAGCNEIQGYYLSAAVAPGEVLKVIASCEAKLSASCKGKGRSRGSEARSTGARPKGRAIRR